MVLHSRGQQAQSTEQARQGRNDDLTDMQLLRQTRRVDGTGTAKGHQHELSRVPAPLGGHGAQGPHGPGVGNAVDAFGRLQQIHVQGSGDSVLNGASGGIRVDDDVSIGQSARTDVSQHHVGIGDGRFPTPAGVAGGSRDGPGAARTHPDPAGSVQKGNAAPARPHFGDVDTGSPNELAASAHQAVARREGSADLVFGAVAYPAFLDQGGLCRGSPHVQGDDVLQAQVAGRGL